MEVPRSLRAAVRALRMQFFVAGALFATLGVHVPAIKAHYGLGERAVALALLAGGAVVPVLFSAAGNLPGIAPARGIAAVSSVGYAGMMAGPPLIGFIAQERSLRAGLLVVVVFGIVVTAASHRALAAQRRCPVR